MKILAKTITGYSYNELDEFAKAEAKSSVLTYDRLTDFFSEDVRSELIEIFGLGHLNTYYSLSYCQGDGLCLYGRITSSELFDNDKFKKIAFKGIHHKQVQSVFDVLQNIDFEHRSRYYHAKTVFIESHIYETTDRQWAITEKVVENVKTWYFTFCREWEKRGYEYFYEISDEDMECVCDEHNNLFTEEGKLINRNIYFEIA